MDISSPFKMHAGDIGLKENELVWVDGDVDHFWHGARRTHRVGATS